ncbi:hypothetical protein [Dongia sp.]|uniref:hypothetical protein n=1 Tax=Dongia sp. TaxID=1977262 RepID=UPI0035B368AD
MRTQIAPFRDPGLWSVLQNGLAVLNGEEMEAARRAIILDCLTSMFSDADRGASTVSGQNMLAVSGDADAIERYSLFLEYLADPIGAELPARLSEAHSSLKELQAGGQVAPDRVGRIREVLEAMLAEFRKAAQTEPLVPIKDFSY